MLFHIKKAFLLVAEWVDKRKVFYITSGYGTFIAWPLLNIQKLDENIWVCQEVELSQRPSKPVVQTVPGCLMKARLLNGLKLQYPQLLHAMWSCSVFAQRCVVMYLWSVHIDSTVSWRVELEEQIVLLKAWLAIVMQHHCCWGSHQIQCQGNVLSFWQLVHEFEPYPSKFPWHSYMVDGLEYQTPQVYMECFPTIKTCVIFVGRSLVLCATLASQWQRRSCFLCYSLQWPWNWGWILWAHGCTQETFGP